MKKVLGLVMAVAVLGGTLTGCGSNGGGSGKDGNSSAEKTAVAYREAYYSLGTDKMMKLMPAEAKEHWEDELSLTSEQLTAYMEQELEKKSDIIKTFKSVSVDEHDELSIYRIQNFIENFLGDVGIKADEAVRILNENGEDARVIGEIQMGEKGVELV